jgi:hypothetical protein
MCLRFVFLLITRVATGLRLSRREEMWKTAEILILRHQIGVLQRLCVPKTLSMSCGQAIFVDQATAASLFSDAVLAEIDWFG